MPSLPHIALQPLQNAIRQVHPFNPITNRRRTFARHVHELPENVLQATLQKAQLLTPAALKTALTRTPKIHKIYITERLPHQRLIAFEIPTGIADLSISAYNSSRYSPSSHVVVHSAGCDNYKLSLKTQHLTTIQNLGTDTPTLTLEGPDYIILTLGDLFLSLSPCVAKVLKTIHSTLPLLTTLAPPPAALKPFDPFNL